MDELNLGEAAVSDDANKACSTLENALAEIRAHGEPWSALAYMPAWEPFAIWLLNFMAKNRSAEKTISRPDFASLTVRVVDQILPKKPTLDDGFSFDASAQETNDQGRLVGQAKPSCYWDAYLPGLPVLFVTEVDAFRASLLKNLQSHWYRLPGVMYDSNSPSPETKLTALAPAESANYAPDTHYGANRNDTCQVQGDFDNISITTDKALLFVEHYSGGRSLQMAIGARQQVPDWIRRTDAFQMALTTGSIIVHTDNLEPATHAKVDSRRAPLPHFENRADAAFWRDRRSEFQLIVDRQRGMGINETHSQRLKGNAFYPPGCEDLSTCQVGTAFNGQILSDFDDAATQAAFRMGCPAAIQPVAFWLYCLAHNLLESERLELQSEILGDCESGGIIRDLAASSAGFCSRLAADSERQRIGQVAPKMSPMFSWQDLCHEFEMHAVEHDDLAGDFDPLRAGNWALTEVQSPRTERLFREVAARAAAKAGVLHQGNEVEPWQLWLEFVWSKDWRKPEKGPARQTNQRDRLQRRSGAWSATQVEGEEGARKLPRVFQTSADCCRDLAEQEPPAATHSSDLPDSGDQQTTESKLPVSATAEIAARRQAKVMPILEERGWSRGKWASKAAVGKNSVYEYLEGERSLSPENRKAMAETIDLRAEELPN